MKTNHNFSFIGGDKLREICASWFVSYAYYEKVDETHKNWNRVSSVHSRISKYKKTRLFHNEWIKEISKMSATRLSKNTIGLSGERVKMMAMELMG